MKDLSLITKKQRNIWIGITIAFGIIAFILTIIEFIKHNTCYSLIGIAIEIINLIIIPKIKSEYHRGEQILTIFENCQNQEKEEIYNFVKKYDKQETH